MGGKSSKLKIKKIKTEKQTQENTKEQKDGVENGEAGTEKLTQNETATSEVVGAESEDKNTPKDITKSENTTTDSTENNEKVDNAPENKEELTKAVLVEVSVRLPSEETQADSEVATAEDIQQTDQSKNEISIDKIDKENEKLEDAEENHGKLEKRVSQEELCSQTLNEEISTEIEANVVKAEHALDSFDKTNEEEEGQTAQVALAETPEIEKHVDEIAEKNAEPDECNDNELKNNSQVESTS